MIVETCAVCGGSMIAVWDGKTVYTQYQGKTGVHHEPSTPSYYTCSLCKAVQLCIDWESNEPKKNPRNGVGEQGSTKSAEGWVERKQAALIRSTEEFSCGCTNRRSSTIRMQGEGVGNEQFREEYSRSLRMVREGTRTRNQDGV